MASSSVFTFADGVDQLASFFFNDKRSPGVAHSKTQRSTELLGLGAVFVLWMIIWADYTSERFPALETASAVVELGGLVGLALRVHNLRSVAGLSTQSLTLYVGYFVLRLSNSLILDGYLPNCKSADFVYQTIHCCSLAVTLHLIYTAHKTYPQTFNEEEDTVPVLPLMLPLVIMAFFGRHILHNDVFFDTVWWTSTEVRAVSLVPQIVLMMKVCGKPSCIPHSFVGLQIASAIMTFTYWYHAHDAIRHADKTVARSAYFLVAICTTHLVAGAAFLWQHVENELALREGALEERMERMDRTLKL